MLAQEGQQGFRPARVGARYDEGAGSKLPGERADLAQGARAEDDPRRGGKFEAHGTGHDPRRTYQPASSGNRFPYFTLAARLGHHRRHGVPPDLVMPGFLVRSRRLGGAIGFHEHKARRVILLLGKVEAGDARLLYALPRIGDGGLFEGLDILRLHMHMDVND